jgi:hypothetical protein
MLAVREQWRYDTSAPGLSHEHLHHLRVMQAATMQRMLDTHVTGK